MDAKQDLFNSFPRAADLPGLLELFYETKYLPLAIQDCAHALNNANLESKTKIEFFLPRDFNGRVVDASMKTRAANVLVENLTELGYNVNGIGPGWHCKIDIDWSKPNISEE